MPLTATKWFEWHHGTIVLGLYSISEHYNLGS